MNVRGAVRALLRRLLPHVARHRWLVRAASPVFLLVPSLKPRLQRIVAAQPVLAPVPKVELNDRQLRVLLDLRDAQPRR